MDDIGEKSGAAHTTQLKTAEQREVHIFALRKETRVP